MASKRRSQRKLGTRQEALVVGKRRGKFTHAALAPSINVTVTVTTTGCVKVTAWLNDVPLQFDGGGKAHAVVGRGQKNSLKWVAIGTAGSSYTIAVCEPEGAGCQGGGTLDQDGRDTGSCDFDT